MSLGSYHNAIQVEPFCNAFCTGKLEFSGHFSSLLICQSYSDIRISLAGLQFALEKR